MVGEGKSLCHNLPSIIPAEHLLINKKALELNNGKSGVGIYQNEYINIMKELDVKCISRRAWQYGRVLEDIPLSWIATCSGKSDHSRIDFLNRRTLRVQNTSVK